MRFRIVMLLMLIFFPQQLLSAENQAHIIKRPEGLRKENPDSSNPCLTTQDRVKWKSVLNWCDECDERARPFTESNDGRYGGIFVYPLKGNQYVVDIQCYMTMRQCEHIYYKVTEHADTIESRSLMLEQYSFAFGKGAVTDVIEEPKEDPKGEFIRFTDTLAYGHTVIPFKNSYRFAVMKEYRGMGGCGLYTVYDVSSNIPYIVEFRAKLYCSQESPMPDEWKLYPADQRAKWKIAANPLREDWKKTNGKGP